MCTLEFFAIDQTITWTTTERKLQLSLASPSLNGLLWLNGTYLYALGKTDLFCIRKKHKIPTLWNVVLQIGYQLIPFLIFWWIGYSGPRFNIKMTYFQYKKSRCGDKTVVTSSYLYNEISNTGKMTSLYWSGPWSLFIDASRRSKYISHCWATHFNIGYCGLRSQKWLDAV